MLNGIMSDDWLKMKDNDPKAAEEMTTIFSDVIWESVLRKTQYLIHRTKNSIKCFQCLQDNAVLVGIDSMKINLLDKDIHKILKSHNTSDIQIYTTEKKYAKSREEEMFEMLNWGCEISEGQMFKQLCLLL